MLLKAPHKKYFLFVTTCKSQGFITRYTLCLRRLMSCSTLMFYTHSQRLGSYGMWSTMGLHDAWYHKQIGDYAQTQSMNLTDQITGMIFCFSFIPHTSQYVSSVTSKSIFSHIVPWACHTVRVHVFSFLFSFCFDCWKSKQCWSSGNVSNSQYNSSEGSSPLFFCFGYWFLARESIGLALRGLARVGGVRHLQVKKGCPIQLDTHVRNSERSVTSYRKTNHVISSVVTDLILNDQRKPLDVPQNKSNKFKQNMRGKQTGNLQGAQTACDDGHHLNRATENCQWMCKTK